MSSPFQGGKGKKQNQLGWRMPLTPAPKRQRLVDLSELEDSLVYMVRPCLKRAKRDNSARAKPLELAVHTAVEQGEPAKGGCGYRVSKGH